MCTAAHIKHEKLLTNLGENLDEGCIGRTAPDATHQGGHQGGQRLAEADVPPVLDTVRQAAHR